MHETKVPPFKDVHAQALESFYRKALKHARRVDWHDEKRRHALRIHVRRLISALGPAWAAFERSRTFWG
jgi:CHAD domain-containing protein